jgi:hypothetical protein
VLCGSPETVVAMSDDRLDDRLMDGIRLTSDAHEAGQLKALRDISAMLEELTNTVRDKIAAIESHRESEH